MAQYKGHFDEYGTLHVYEEEPSPGLAALPLVIYKTVCLLTWVPWLIIACPIWILSIIRGIRRIKGKEKVASGVYLLTVGILCAIAFFVILYLLYIGKL